ncbi:MAG: HAD family phosphatase [Beijerinckiaceae bacterium]|jgi:HAD superfamily hydrolase (TIGR01509 family)|nr:HAD family phosphatase [Beijerinckiaceae bacterium]
MSLADIDLVVFDCDGVLINSEELASEICVAAVRELGLHLTPHQYADRYAGHPVAEIWRRVEEDCGKPLPAGFRETVDTDVRRRFETELVAITGVAELLAQLVHPRCVASSSHITLLRANLGRVGLIDYFDPHVFSGSQVKRGKPAPDVFLYAASQMGADPARCLVIEDSMAGVTAARRAGMKAIGFAGGGHASEVLHERLLEAGAVDVFKTMQDIWGYMSR